MKFVEMRSHVYAYDDVRIFKQSIYIYTVSFSNIENFTSYDHDHFSLNLFQTLQSIL